MGNIGRLWQLMRADRHLALLNIVFNILSAFFSVFSLLMLIPFLQVLFYGSSMSVQKDSVTEVPFLKYFYEIWLEYLLVHGKSAALTVLCISLILVFLLKNTFRFLALYVLVPVRTGIMMRLRHQIYTHLLRLGYPFYQKTRRGDVLTRFGQDVQEVEYGIVNFMEIGLKEPVTIVITLISLVWMSPILTLWVLVLLPVSALIIGRIGKFLRRQSYQAQQEMSVLQAMVDELMHGIRIIRSLGADQQMDQKFSMVNEGYRQLHTSMLRRKELASPLSEVLGISVVAVLLMIGGNWVLKSNGLLLSPEVFITYIVVFSQIISPAKAFANAWYFIQKGVASLQRIDELLAEPIIDSKANAVSKESFDEGIHIMGLSYAFDEKLALQDINLDVQKGERVAIVGPSGSGKTTLINLLCGFYHDPHNSIVIDRDNLNDIRREDWQKLYAIVTQEPILFFGTVRENLMMAKPDATEAEIFVAITLADAAGFITDLPSGLDTSIGERGVQLSGGQQQRLSLARAFLRNAPVLILDEATASLDSQSDQSVRAAIRRLAEGKTVIAIAHRLSSIRTFDRIVVLENGMVTGSGTHEQLLSKHPTYQQLVAGQRLDG